MEYAGISARELRAVVSFGEGELLRHCLSLTLSPNPELVAATLLGLAHLFDQSDELLVRNDNDRQGNVYIVYSMYSLLLYV